jgi:hypothetical protein
MARLSDLLRRWRCWWERPLGHVDEMIEYVDPLSGRWAARIRCARCARETGLAVGYPQHGAVFPGNPLATMMSRQGFKRSAPPSEKFGAGPPSLRPGWIEVETPEAELISLRCVRARLALGRIRQVYLAVPFGSPALPEAAFELRTALAAAGGKSADAPWLDRVVAQLEPELRPAS